MEICEAASNVLEYQAPYAWGVRSIGEQSLGTAWSAAIDHNTDACMYIITTATAVVTAGDLPLFHRGDEIGFSCTVLPYRHTDTPSLHHRTLAPTLPKPGTKRPPHDLHVSKGYKDHQLSTNRTFRDTHTAQLFRKSISRDTRGWFLPSNRATFPPISPQPAPQPPPPVNVIQPPTIRRMAEVVPLFYGDLTTAENASDFLKAFNRSMLIIPQVTDAQKIDILSNYLGTDSPAEKWYRNLAGAQLTSWDDFTRAFKTRWPLLTSVVTPTSEEYQTELLALMMPESEIGTIKSMGGQKVWAHVKWAWEALELAMLAGIETESTLIWQVKKQLPMSVRKLLDDEYADWKTFTDAVKGLSTTKLRQEREEIEERTKREEEREQKLLQKVEAATRQ